MYFEFLFCLQEEQETEPPLKLKVVYRNGKWVKVDSNHPYRATPLLFHKFLLTTAHQSVRATPTVLHHQLAPIREVVLEPLPTSSQQPAPVQELVSASRPVLDQHSDPVHQLTLVDQSDSSTAKSLLSAELHPSCADVSIQATAATSSHRNVFEEFFNTFCDDIVSNGDILPLEFRL